MKCIIDAPRLTGEVGALLAYFDRALCIGEVVREVSGPTFTDHSAEARTEGGTAFNLLAATTDRIYLGYDDTFSGFRFKKGTGGAGVTLVVEYWNGAAWVTVSGLSDGTSNLSADGEATWTRPTRGQWIKNSINGGPSMYHLRLTTTSGPSTTPTADFLVVNWTIYDDAAGTNQKVYKSIGESGSDAIYILVKDNSQRLHSEAAASAQQAVIFSYEAWDAVLHTGTGQCPSSFTNDGYGVHKSNSSDSTARNVVTFVSRDRVAMAVFTGQTAGQASATAFGRLESYVAGDAFPQFVALVRGATTTLTLGLTYNNSTVALALSSGYFVQRGYTGTGGATPAAPVAITVGDAGTNGIPYPNGPDGSLVCRQLLVIDNTGGGSTGHLRGALPDIVGIPHVTSAALLSGGSDVWDTFTRQSDGKKFRVLRLLSSANVIAAWVGFEDHA